MDVDEPCHCHSLRALDEAIGQTAVRQFVMAVPGELDHANDNGDSADDI